MQNAQQYKGQLYMQLNPEGSVADDDNNNILAIKTLLAIIQN